MFSCPICSSNSFFLFNSKLNKKIYHCESNACGHFFTPVLEVDQGICARPEDIQAESDDFMLKFDERNKRLLELFISVIKKENQNLKLNLLDYGAGNAHISRTFKSILNKKANIYCVEKNKNCKDLYKKYNLIYINSLEEINDQIDLIYMIEVIEHLENPIDELKRLSKLLKNGGKIFITTPVGREKENTTNAYDTPSHLHFFTEKSLNLTLRKSGLSEIEEFKFFSQLYPTTSIKGKIKNFIQNFYRIESLKNFFFNKYKIGHLVGFSKLKN